MEGRMRGSILVPSHAGTELHQLCQLDDVGDEIPQDRVASIFLERPFKAPANFLSDAVTRRGAGRLELSASALGDRHPHLLLSCHLFPKRNFIACVILTMRYVEYDYRQEVVKRKITRCHHGGWLNVHDVHWFGRR